MVKTLQRGLDYIGVDDVSPLSTEGGSGASRRHLFPDRCPDRQHASVICLLKTAKPDRGCEVANG